MSLQPLRGSLASWTPRVGRPRDPVHALAIAWPAIAGADVAANSTPVALAAGALTIATRSSAWSQQLQLLSPPILRGIAEHVPEAGVTRLVFRAGAFRGERTAPASNRGVRVPARRASDGVPGEPAADLAEAFDRMVRRIRATRRNADAHCDGCGAPLAPQTNATTCTPCAIASTRERVVALERLIFAAPWLRFEELRELQPRLTVAAYERARTRLLSRWWIRLERVRTRGRGRAPAAERAIASSYVLLQSRIAPDRITPAVVRNILGAELDALLFADRAGR